MVAGSSPIADEAGGSAGGAWGQAPEAGAGGLDLPATVIEELRAMGHHFDDARAYDDRVFGSSLLPRRGGALPVPTLHRKAADMDLRAGMYVAVSTADVDVHWPSEGLHGLKLVGSMCAMDRVGVVESVDRASETAKVVLYDASQGALYVMQQPISSLDRLTRHIGGLHNMDCSNHEALARASLDVDTKLACAYARACVAAVLSSYQGLHRELSGVCAYTSDAQVSESAGGGGQLRESVLGGRARLIKLVHAAAIEDATAQVTRYNTGSKSGAHAVQNEGPRTLPDALAVCLHALIDAESNKSSVRIAADEGMKIYSSADDGEKPRIKESPKRKIDEQGVGVGTVYAVSAVDESGKVEAARDKRRRYVSDMEGCSGAATAADMMSVPQTQTQTSALGAAEASPHSKTHAHDMPDKEAASGPPLLVALHDECLQAFKNAVTAACIVEESSEHPLVRGASGSLGASHVRRCMQAEGASKLFVVFDTRCALLPGETIKFYADSACTDLIGAATMDERRKAYQPLLLPSPVWMQMSNGNGGDDTDSTWGYRVVGFPIAEKSLSVAMWLASLLVDRISASSSSSSSSSSSGTNAHRAGMLMECIMDLLDRAQNVAPPHCKHLHSLAACLVPEIVRTTEGHALLASHSTFAKLTTEARLRHTWETRSSLSERASDGIHGPVSTYLGSLCELLAYRSAALDMHRFDTAGASFSGDEFMAGESGESRDKMELDKDVNPRYLSVCLSVCLSVYLWLVV